MVWTLALLSISHWNGNLLVYSDWCYSYIKDIVCFRFSKWSIISFFVLITVKCSSVPPNHKKKLMSSTTLWLSEIFQSYIRYHLWLSLVTTNSRTRYQKRCYSASKCIFPILVISRRKWWHCSWSTKKTGKKQMESLKSWIEEKMDFERKQNQVCEQVTWSV